jgi:two-component system cell cycle response regulator DivK
VKAERGKIKGGRPMASKKKILVVDDDPGMAGLLADFCAELGCDVRVQTDSRQVVDAVLTWRPDLVTLDLEMPHVDGLEILRDLRSRPETRAVPVIVVSCMAGDVSLARDVVQGLYSKPVNFQNFLARVGGLLQLSPLRTSA